MTERSFELDVLLGVANAAADASTSPKLWSELSAVYSGSAYVANPSKPAGSVGIFISRYPEDQDSVTLEDYTVADDPSLSDQIIGVQVTIKAKSLDRVKAIGALFYDLLQGRWGGTLGTVTLVTARRASGTNLGQDSSERQGRVENYYLTVHRPSPHRQ